MSLGIVIRKNDPYRNPKSRKYYIKETLMSMEKDDSFSFGGSTGLSGETVKAAVYELQCVIGKKFFIVSAKQQKVYCIKTPPVAAS